MATGRFGAREERSRRAARMEGPAPPIPRAALIARPPHPVPGGRRARGGEAVGEDLWSAGGSVDNASDTTSLSATRAAIFSSRAAPFRTSVSHPAP